jgi:hypothetical protein
MACQDTQFDGVMFLVSGERDPSTKSFHERAENPIHECQRSAIQFPFEAGKKISLDETVASALTE